MIKYSISILCFTLLFLLTSSAYTDQQKEIIENVGNGSINWSKGCLKAIGIGAPPEHLYGKPNARPMALRAAKLDALRNLLEVTKGVRIDSSTIVKNFALEHDVIESKVHGMVMGAQVTNREYMSDGSVEVTMLMSLHGGFSQLVLPADIKQIVTVMPVTTNQDSVLSPNKSSNFKNNSEKYTGLIVDTRGISVKPAMSIVILDENDQEIYGTAFVSREFAVQKGMCGYVKNPESARNDPRVKGNPLTVKGLRTKGDGQSDIVISNADASRIQSFYEHLAFFKECRVIIITD
ncbi:MAG: hypothetical protein J7K84_11665 [Deltaproteobacteria bacterium]|nr:hypothetical protein [Deltaproteobacteria bacterium]